MKENEFNHFDQNGNAVMVDVSDKAVTKRKAVASGKITMNLLTFQKVAAGQMKKGDVLNVARVAGIMATKKTSDLIPMCHPLFLEKVSLDFILHEDELTIEAVCQAQVTAKTGVEMEALSGVSTALLTIYDMCKAVDRGMEIHSLHLLEKSGGKSGTYKRD